MLEYFPVPAFAEGICGLAYSLCCGEQAVSLRLPALTAQVQVTLAGSVRHEGAGRGHRADPPLALIGPTTAADTAVLAPQTRLIGLGLLPAGWVRSVRASAAELADTIVAGDAIWGARAASLVMEEMLGAADTKAAVAALFRFAAARPVQPGSDVDARIALVTRWVGDAGSVEIAGLARSLDLSLRQTERFTGQVFGARPKLLELKYRVLRLAAASAIGSTRVYDVRHDDLVDSFYDQSHLIRNFHRFVGHTPSGFDKEAEFARAMMQGRWNKGARSPMMLWS